jgi:hypothetical protein
VRRILAGIRADELDTPGIRRAQAAVTLVAAQRLRPFHIIVDSVDLRTLGLLFTSTAYAAVVDTSVAEQNVFLAQKQVELARRQNEARLEVARGIAAAHAIVAPTLTPQVLQEGAIRAQAALLASPSSVVEIRATSDSTITEVEP